MAPREYLLCNRHTPTSLERTWVLRVAMNSNRAHLAPADAADGCSIITLIPAAPCWAWPLSSSGSRKKRQRERETPPSRGRKLDWAFAFWLTSGLAAHPWMTPSLLSPSLSICCHLNLPHLLVPWLGLLSLPYPLPFTPHFPQIAPLAGHPFPSPDFSTLFAPLPVWSVALRRREGKRFPLLFCSSLLSTSQFGSSCDSGFPFLLLAPAHLGLFSALRQRRPSLRGPFLDARRHHNHASGVAWSG